MEFQYQVLQWEKTSNEQRNWMIEPLGQRPVGRHMRSIDEEKKERKKTDGKIMGKGTKY